MRAGDAGDAPAARAASRAIIRATQKSPEEPLLFSIIQAAGWPIWPLILCSIVALALVIERLSTLREARVHYLCDKLCLTDHPVGVAS